MVSPWKMADLASHTPSQFLPEISNRRGLTTRDLAYPVTTTLRPGLQKRKVKIFLKECHAVGVDRHTFSPYEYSDTSAAGVHEEAIRNAMQTDVERGQNNLVNSKSSGRKG